jgi:hypothetical protein
MGILIFENALIAELRLVTVPTYGPPEEANKKGSDSHLPQDHVQLRAS